MLELLGLIPPILLAYALPLLFPRRREVFDSRVLQSSETYHRLPLPLYRLINMFNSMVLETHELSSLIWSCKVLAQVSRKAQTRQRRFCRPKESEETWCECV